MQKYENFYVKHNGNTIDSFCQLRICNLDSPFL